MLFLSLSIFSSCFVTYCNFSDPVFFFISLFHILPLALFLIPLFLITGFRYLKIMIEHALVIKLLYNISASADEIIQLIHVFL